MRLGHGEGLAIGGVAGGVVLMYALPGGTYDLVPRQQIGILAWWIVAIGIATGRLPRQRPSRTAYALVGALALCIAWTAASFSWTESDERTSIELARLLHHVGVVVLALSLVTRQTWAFAAGGVAVGAVLVCVVAFGSRLFPSLFPTDYVRANYSSNRLSYPLNYWNAVGAWCAISGTLAFAFAAHARSALARGAWISAIPLVVATGYVTYSRQAAGGILVGVIVVWLLSPWRVTVVLHAAIAAAASYIVIRTIRGEPEIVAAAGGEGASEVAVVLLAVSAICGLVAYTLQRSGGSARMRLSPRVGRPAMLVTTLAAMVAAVFVLPPVADRAWDEFRAASEATSATTDPGARFTSLNGNRYNLYRTAIEAFEQEPLTGLGPGTFEFWWNKSAVNP